MLRIEFYTIFPRCIQMYYTEQEENMIGEDGGYIYIALIINPHDADVHGNNLCLFSQVFTKNMKNIFFKNILVDTESYF